MSIVGADLLPDSGYLRAKVAQEAEIEAGAIPYTILRATQFFEFLSQIVEAGAEGDSVRLSTGLIQFVAADDVAATMAELAIGAPEVRGRIELGGPEALGIDAWARRLFAVTGDTRAVIGDPHARYYGTELHAGELTPGVGARIGKVDFDTWFAADQPAERDATSVRPAFPRGTSIWLLQGRTAPEIRQSEGTCFAYASASQRYRRIRARFGRRGAVWLDVASCCIRPWIRKPSSGSRGTTQGASSTTRAGFPVLGAEQDSRGVKPDRSSSSAAAL